MAIRDKIVKIAYELKDKFSGRVGKITGSIRAVGTQSDATSVKIKANNASTARSFGGITAAANKARLGLLALGAGLLVLVSGVSKWTRAANTQERAETKLATSLRNLTGASKEQIQALKDQASELQKTTGFGDELILSAQAQLATFQLTADQIKQLTPLLVDMGESQRKLGQDTVDLESTALALGKTFTTGIGALSRYGVALTDAQKEAFKLGTQQQKVDVVVKALTDNFGGLAEAVGNKYEGSVRKADAAQGDFNETLGNTFTQNKDFVDFVDRLGEGWVNLGESVKESGREINATISFVFRTFKVFTGSGKVAFNFLQLTLKTALALIDDTLALFALGLSKITFGSVSDEFERVANSLAATSADLKKSLSADYFNDIGEGANDVVEAFVGLEKQVEKTNKKVVDSSKKTTEQLNQEKIVAKSAADAQKARAKALSDSLKASQNALKKDLENAKSITAEFQQLINDVQAGPEKDAKDLTIIDFATGITDAQNALNRGDFDGAIDGARQTADVIRKLKEEGTESGIVLTGLAQQLKRVADAAAAAKVQQDQNTVAQSQQALQEKTDAKPIVTKLVLDTSEAEAQLAALQEKAAKTITQKIFVSAEGNSFSDRPGQGFTELAREALKKGTK